MSSAISFVNERRATAKAALQPPPPGIIAFRNAAGEIQYTSAPETNSSSAHATSRQPSFHTRDQQYDSDAEPLLRSGVRSTNYNDLTEEEKARFTATGRPIQEAASNTSLQTWAGDMFTPPRLLPKQYTDDSIIPAIVTNVIPSKTVAVDVPDKKRRKSFSSIFKGKEDKKSEHPSKGLTKVVFMPRREYLKYFAKDDNGVYVGTEPQKQWTEEELDQLFKDYRPNHYLEKGRMKAGTINGMTSAWAMGQRA